MLWERVKNLLLDKKIFFKGSTVLVFTTVLSYALGLLRDRILATTFGASRALDAYNAAFTLPDLILNIFVAGALTAAFVPIFSELSVKERKAEADQFTNSVISSSLGVVIISGLAVFFLTPALSKIIVPGFSPEERSVFTNLTRLLLLSPIIFSISNTFGNILLIKNKNFWYGISAACYNLGIIGGAVFLSPKFGIYGVALGAIGGAVFHLISRMIGLGKLEGLKLKIKVNEEFKKFIRLMLPKVIGHPIEQLTFLGFTIIASTVGSGAIAILNFARNFQSMPINIIGVNLALAVFPALARAEAEDNKNYFRSELNFVLKFSFALTLAAAVLMIVLRKFLIGLFLGGGAFGPDAVAATATTLAFFSLSIPGESACHVLARGFYSLKDSLTPVLVGLVSLIFSIGLGYMFAKQMGVPGLALGFFFGSTLKTLILLGLIRIKTSKLA
jgi:putative peptidoglycan lipid II flippase